MKNPTERLPSARRIATTLAVMVLVAAVIPFAVFAVPQAVGADHGFVILSGSMEPTVSPGDVVIVDDSAVIAVGDVVTFDDGNSVPTTHRVVGIEDGQYVTQGDANQNPDTQRVAPGEALGRVTLTIPYIGHVILWVNTPLGYLSLVVAPLVLLVASELFTWARTRGDGDSDGTDDEEHDSDGTDDEEHDSDGTDDEESKPTPKPAIRHIDEVHAERTAVERDEDEAATAIESESDGDRETVTVAVADLKLTILAMVGLVGYAAWNVYREVSAVAAPDPVSVGALTGGLLGLGFAVWVTVTARVATADAKTDRPSRTPEAHADGGTEAEQ